MMRRKISNLLLCLSALTGYAQDFEYKANINAVQQKGYYKVALSPELLGKLNDAGTDLRIYDSLGVEQPYFFDKEPVIQEKSLFKEYEVIKKNYRKNAISYLIFENPDKLEINNVSFVVKNTAVKKRARLSGSDDQRNWYVIKDNYLLHAMYTQDATSEMKILNFPLSDYQYFKLELDDNWELPINILKVGYYDRQKTNGLISSFDFEVESQKDTLKTSFVKLVLSEDRYFEQLKIELSGADFYARSARVFRVREVLNRKKQKKTIREAVGYIELNSNSENVLSIDSQGISVRELYLEIDNKDNQPLKVDKVSASCLNQYAILELLPSQRYTLKFGDQKVRAPQYDLIAFKDEIIPKSIRNVHQKVTLANKESITTAAKGIFDNSYIIWSVIIAIGLVLGYVSIKMIQDISKK